LIPRHCQAENHKAQHRETDMKRFISPVIGAIIMVNTAHAQQPNPEGRRFSSDAVRSVAPALEHYTQDHLYGDVWKRPGLNSRDRSLVTIAALIARGEAEALNYYADQALENGVKPAEISETITHLAYYSGWGKAMTAIGPVSEVFAKRRIGADQLPTVKPTPLPLERRLITICTRCGQR
jgi:4-carboxymuconolactone decarboxylase